MGDSQIKVAAKALAELYVWDCLVEILEGSTAPRSRSGQKTAERVIALCKREQHKLLRQYDATIEQGGGDERR
jgi:hypothetical protein